MRSKAIVLLLLTLTAATSFSQTFMIVAREIRDGEELSRPFASQEGMIEGMFDLGFVSFDTGLYDPAVDWRFLDFQEPLDIARRGLAQYLLAADVRSYTEPRNQATAESANAQVPPEPALKIRVSVRYYLFDVRASVALGEGEIVLDNDSADKAGLTYSEFLHSAGRKVAARGIDLMRATTGKP